MTSWITVIPLLALVATAAQTDVIEIATKVERDQSTRSDVYVYPSRERKANLSLVREPLYRGQPRYLKLAVGDAPGRDAIVVVIDEVKGKPPRVYVDSNNNGDLTDDGPPALKGNTGSLLFRDLTIKASFAGADGRQEVVLYYRCFYKSESREHLRVYFVPRYSRSGVLRLAESKYKVSVSTANPRALYSNVRQVTLGIDVNGDGKIDVSALSGEVFAGAGPFNLGGESYHLQEVSAAGDRMRLAISRVKVSRKNHVVVGAAAPDFDFTTLDGKRGRLSDFLGQPVLVDFMASWCGYCVAALPGLKGLQQEYGGRGLRVLSISLDGGESTDSQRVDLERLVAEKEIDWPVAFDDRGIESPVASAYNVESIPVHVLLDRSGTIRFIGQGGSEEEMDELRAAIRHLTRVKGARQK